MDIAELRHTFATRIRGLREGKMNQGEFADSVGISRGAMSYYEQEARTPDIGVLRTICEKYNVSADYLLGLIPDTNHAVSDVCRETGLTPQAVKRLNIIQRIRKFDFSPDKPFVEQATEKIVYEFDDAELEATALKLLVHNSLPTMLSVLLTHDEGLAVLTLLGAIITGAEFHTGSSEEPHFKIKTSHKNIELEFPLKDLTAALWVNIQNEIQILKKKVDEANSKNRNNRDMTE